MITDFRAVLRTHGIPDAGVSPSRLKLATHYEYSRGHDERRHAGYKCQADFEIETEAIASLQQLLIEVVDAGVDRIDGIEVDVRAKPALRPRARRDAVAAARAKAELYAEAAGITLGRVLHIEDVDPERWSRTAVPRSRRPPRNAVAHRVVQEALANAAKHAPEARVLVRLSHCARALTVSVTNQAPPAGPPSSSAGGGRGLPGLAEQARRGGGMLHAGPTPAVGFRGDRRAAPRWCPGCRPSPHSP